MPLDQVSAQFFDALVGLKDRRGRLCVRGPPVAELPVERKGVPGYLGVRGSGVNPFAGDQPTGRRIIAVSEQNAEANEACEDPIARGDLVCVRWVRLKPRKARRRDPHGD